MPYLQSKPHTNFWGIHSEGDGTDIHGDETPDSRNDNISEPGELSTRPGMTKDVTSAIVSAQEVMDVGYIDVDGVNTKLAIMNDGSLRSYS